MTFKTGDVEVSRLLFRPAVLTWLTLQKWSKWCVDNEIELTVSEPIHNYQLYEYEVYIFAYVDEKHFSYWLLKWGNPEENLEYLMF